jgi:AcrR family transcriptional regulator
VTRVAEPVAADLPSGPAPGRGEATRRAIVETALRLFRERGYDKTTMRAIATEAGVSVGNAYYYFASKEHLVQAFYDQLHEEHVQRVRVLLDREPVFADRLAGTLLAWLEVARPYHAFAGKFFKNAAEPTSPLSPFSAESAPARDASIELFREVLEGSDAKVDPQLRPELPELLWLAHMGTVLFWVHDTSTEQSRSEALVAQAVPLIDRLVGLSRLRVLRPVTRQLVDLLHAISAASAQQDRG